jgi:pSer/pThr/pTyr-binding forkhead associated (FHA) protein
MERDHRFSLTFMSGPHDGMVTYWEPPANGDEFILTIGRRPGCDLCIPDDQCVSRLHAGIIYDLRQHYFYLEDFGSHNGTIFNHLCLHGRIPIMPGALFRVGRTWLKLEVCANQADDEEDTIGRQDLLL